MTSLAVTLSVDSRGPAGLYIICDSRITWQADHNRWDCGQKTFASSHFPDIFGYCGDAYFPPMLLGQVVEQLDTGLICARDASAETRHSNIRDAMTFAMERIVGSPPMLDFTIYHGARENMEMESFFRLWELRYEAKTGTWSEQERKISEDKSYIVRLDGSGSKTISQRASEWEVSSIPGTSRTAIWSFCEALQSGDDKFSGGPPQLVGLWRIGAGRRFGFFWHGKPHLGGLQISVKNTAAEIQWFNHLFERCDGLTGKRIKSAQRHTKPKKGPP